MPGLTTHIVLLCIGTGFFIAVEGLNIMIKDASNADVEGNFHEINSREKSSNLEMIKWLNDDRLKENLRRLTQIKEKRTMNALVKELNTNENKNDNIETHKKKSLRFGDVKGFMQKLNSFIQQGMYKNYGTKRDDCNFGFRNPLSRKCKKEMGTSHLDLFKLVQHSAEDNKERRRHYKQHMVEERARYSSDSDNHNMVHTAEDNKERRGHYKQHMVDEPARYSSDSDNDDMVQHTAKDNKERRKYFKQHMVEEPVRYSSDSDNDDMVQHTAEDNKERRRDYKQHMVEERARYSSDSDNEDKRYSGKSRFEVVGNAKQKKKQTRQKVSSESAQSESEESNSDYEEPKKVYESSDSAERKPEETANDEDSEREKESEEKASDSDRSSESSEEYMYLQGSRLVKPQAPRSRSNNYGRDASGLFKLPYSRRDHEDKRLPYFMPKRYDWDPSMIHDLDSFWNIGIKSKMHPYNRFWFF